MTLPSRPARLVGLSVVFGLIIGLASLASAQELIAPRSKDRKFPTTYCPLPIDFAFVANGPMATIRFSTQNVFYFDDFTSQVEWSRQSLDNICVAPEGVYNANLVPVSPTAFSADCYFGEPVPNRFRLQNAGSIPLKEVFDTDPAPRGWDLANGAYWDQLTTAPNDPGSTDENDFDPLGCLGLGKDTPGRALTDSAYTSLTFSGLTNGTTYVLSGWWNCQMANTGKIFLVVRVYGTNGPVPIARRTWGELKRRYR